MPKPFALREFTNSPRREIRSLLGFRNKSVKKSCNFRCNAQKPFYSTPKLSYVLGCYICAPEVRPTRRWEPFASSKCSTMGLSRLQIFDAQGWHLLTPWIRLLNLQQRRPLPLGAATTVCALLFLSGTVPIEDDGGRRCHLSLKLFGEACGPDCFLVNFLRSSMYDSKT
jgi:hypothetical protein